MCAVAVASVSRMLGMHASIAARLLRVSCTALSFVAHLSSNLKRLQVQGAGSSNFAAAINTLQTATKSSDSILSVAAQIPFATVPDSRRRLASTSPTSAAPTISALHQSRIIRSQLDLSGSARSLLVASPATPYFDVNGDGVFTAADYVLLLKLGLAWSNEYAADASPWLARFRALNGGAAVSDWQLQSTDPDFMCAYFFRSGNE